MKYSILSKLTDDQLRSLKGERPTIKTQPHYVETPDYIVALAVITFTGLLLAICLSPLYL